MIIGGILPIVIGVILVLVIGSAGYYIARDRKGKLEIHMPTTGVNSGDSLTGTVIITTKKSLEARRFFVAFIGYEKLERERQHGDKHHNSSSETKEIYREEYSFLDGELLPPNMNKSFDFAFVAPGKDTIDTSQGGGGMQIKIGPLSMGDNRRRTLEWKIETRVDLPGVDLARSRSVRVNVS